MKKTVVKRVLALLIAAMMLLGCVGCGKKQEQENPGNVQSGSVVMTETNDTREAIKTALTQLIDNKVMPDGKPAPEVMDFEHSSYAVFDADNDGKEELVLYCSSDVMAGLTGYVFGFDKESNTFSEELSAFPMMTFYDNGTILGEWSHGEGRSDDQSWPFDVYTPDAASDKYIKAGSMFAWSKSVVPDGYPESTDTSGFGTVYFISDGESYNDSVPSDVSEYNNWLHTFIGGAEEVKPEFFDLSKENVEKVVE